MRVLFATLFVFIGTIAVVTIVTEFGPSDSPPWLVAPAGVIAFFGLLALAFFLFNIIGRRKGLVPHGDSVEELEAKGLLIQNNFQARRAFQIEECEDEGSHYMIELQNGSVLYLNGQYLYDYEPITDDPELNQPRTFPCTEFTVRRHKVSGDGIDIICRGEVLEPECLAPSFDHADFKRGLNPEDGQIFTDKAYEELKRERMKGGFSSNHV